MRALGVAVLLLVGAVALPGMAAPAGATDGPASAAVPPDPAEDRLGWECGYWYNESLDVDGSDGLDDAELEAVVCRAMARVEHIRRLEFGATPNVSVISRETFRARQANRPEPSPALRAFDNAKFEALFLINESADSIAVQRRNRGAGVLGFYDSRADDLVLVSEGGGDPTVDEFTLAHELVHALQDQHFGLGRYAARTRDGANAENGLIEGDASYVTHRYRARCEAGWTCLEPPGGGGGDLANIGVYFLTFQPYSDGPAFVASLRDRGGWAAVNRAYEDPPVSTEQVIHPEKYPNETPANVTLADVATGSWERVRPPGRPDHAVLGEAALATMFVYPLYDSRGGTVIVPAVEWLNRTDDGRISRFDPFDYATEHSTGWDGDRLHVYRNATNETAYVWRLRWDSPAAAASFEEGYRELLAYHGAERVAEDTYRIPAGGFADAFRVAVNGTRVTIVNAPAVAALEAVRPTDGTGEGTETVAPPSGDTTTRSAVTPPTAEVTRSPAGGTPTTVRSPATGETPTTVRSPATGRTPTTVRSPAAGGTSPTTPVTTPGFGVLAALLALLALAARARR